MHSAAGPMIDVLNGQMCKILEDGVALWQCIFMQPRDSNLRSMMPVAHTLQRVNDNSALTLPSVALDHDERHDGIVYCDRDVSLGSEGEAPCRRYSSSGFEPRAGPSFSSRNDVGAFGCSRVARQGSQPS